MGLGVLLYERNDLDGAVAHLQPGTALGQQERSHQVVVAGLVYLSRVQRAQGDAGAAARSLTRAVTLAAEHGMEHCWMVPSVAAELVRLSLALGNLGDAADLARSLGDRPAGKPLPEITREAEQLARARVSIAQGRPDEALGPLRALSEAASRQGRVRSEIEIGVLWALAAQAVGKTGEALRALDQALALAAPGGFARVFLDEAPGIIPVLRASAREGGGRGFALQLLAALVPPGEAPVGPASPARTHQPLPESLTERELAVLRLVAAGATNQEIAERAFIAVNTVKKHLKNVFGKLEASSRTQAVARARDLGLL